MKYLKIYLLILVVSANYHLSSQSELENHRKYYYYKTRLQNDFMKVGLLPGESIPLNERDPQGAFDRQNQVQNQFPFTGSQTVTLNQSQLESLLQPPGKLHIGDGTARLGIYISALATEYRLLKNNGQDTKRVVHELFCALNAFNRIDFNTEIAIAIHPLNPNSQPAVGNLNGFFMRDDVPRNFVQNNYTHFNYYNSGLDPNNMINYPERGSPGPAPVNPTKARGFTQTYFHPIADEHSSLIGFSEGMTSWNASLDGFEESQDQVFYLLMACAFVKEMVTPGENDSGAIFGFGPSRTDIWQEAIDISDRILKHISSDPLYNIRNPSNNNNFTQVGWATMAVGYALDNAGCFIKDFGIGGDFTSNELPNFQMSFPTTAFNMPLAACTDYRQAISANGGAGWANFANLTNFSSNIGNGVNNSNIFQVLASVCNCIYDQVLLKNLSIQAQIDALNAQIQDALDNAASDPLGLLNIPGFTASIIALSTQLFSLGAVNVTDLRLAHISSGAPTVFEDKCVVNGADLHRSGTDFVFPVFARDILHARSGHPQLSSNQQIQGYNNTPGHDQLKNQLETILNDAPCDGNSFLTPTTNQTGNWGVSNRCDLQMGLFNLPCRDQFAEYQGTDYMLMHNLFYLREGASIGTIDYSFREVTVSLPIGSEFTSSNKRTLGAFEEIVANNVVNNNAAADYRAGKEIALMPGFSAIKNCEFGAFIEPFNGICNNPDMFRSSAGSGIGGFYGATNYSGPVLDNKYQAHDKQLAFDPTEAINDVNELVKAHKSLQIANDQTSFKDSPVNVAKKFDIYPNPNAGEFKIEFNGLESDDFNLTICDVLGQEIYNQQHLSGYKLLSVSLKDFSKGVYTTKIYRESKLVVTKKIVIQ